MNIDGLLYNLRNAAPYDKRMMVVPKEDLEEAIEAIEEYKKQMRVARKFKNLAKNIIYCVIGDDGYMYESGNGMNDVLWDAYCTFEKEEYEE